MRASARKSGWLLAALTLGVLGGSTAAVERTGPNAALAAGERVTQERRLVTESDILKFIWIADPQISPDGALVAFVRVSVNDHSRFRR